MGWKACPLGQAGRQAGGQEPLTGCGSHRGRSYTVERAPQSEERRGKPRTRPPVRVWSIVVGLALAVLDGGEEERERRRSGFPFSECRGARGES